MTEHQAAIEDQKPHRRIAVAQPDLSGREHSLVSACVTEGWVSSHGRFIPEFEAGFGKAMGVAHAAACNNGTTALHLALLAAGVQPGDEVIVPSMTYVATANAVRYCNAVPVFADSDADTMNIMPSEIERLAGPHTRAVIPVHLWGHPADMDPILEITRDRGLTVVEDAAEAHGARYRGRGAGGLGDIATFSFFGNKIITTGEGGMVTTDNPAMDATVRQLRGQGVDPDRRYWFPVVGFNYRMTNIQAALGVAQLDRLDEFLEKRREVAAGYDERLRSHAALTLPSERDGCTSAWWMYTIVLADSVHRNALIATLDADGIETRPTFHPVHLLPPYNDGSTVLPVAERLGRSGLSLPTHTSLTDSDLDRVCERLLHHTRSQSRKPTRTTA